MLRQDLTDTLIPDELFLQGALELALRNLALGHQILSQTNLGYRLSSESFELTEEAPCLSTAQLTLKDEKFRQCLVRHGRDGFSYIFISKKTLVENALKQRSFLACVLLGVMNFYWSQESRAFEYPLEEAVRNRFRRGRCLDLFLGESPLRQQNRTEPTRPFFFDQPRVRAAIPSGGNLARDDLSSRSGPTDYIVPAVLLFIAAGDVCLARKATMDDEISEARERPLVDDVGELALAKGEELRIIIVMDA